MCSCLSWRCWNWAGKAVDKGEYLMGEPGRRRVRQRPEKCTESASTLQAIPETIVVAQMVLGGELCEHAGVHDGPDIADTEEAVYVG